MRSVQKTPPCPPQRGGELGTNKCVPYRIWAFPTKHKLNQGGLMRHVLTLFLVIFTFLSCAKAAHDHNAMWLEDYDTALSLASKIDKPILINFTGSDWCVWCQRLSDEVFSQTEFITYASENLVLLKIDFLMNTPQPEEIRNANIALMEKYAVQGFPTIVFIDSEENVLAQTGYQPDGVKAYIEHIEEILKGE